MSPSDKEILEKYGIIFDTLDEDVTDMVISKADTELIRELDFARDIKLGSKYQSLRHLRKVNGSSQPADKMKTKRKRDDTAEKSTDQSTTERFSSTYNVITNPPSGKNAESGGDLVKENTVADKPIDDNTAETPVSKTVITGKIAERLAEKYAEVGFRGFSKDEVLEYILCKVTDNDKIEETVNHLMDKFGTLENVLNADRADLAIAGLSPEEITAITQHRELQRYLCTHKPTKICLTNTEIAGEFCRERFGGDVVESFYVISLDAVRNVKACTLISRGIENRAEAYLISVLRAAMAHRATAILLCHNHPGGNLRPSNEDIAMTQDIVNMCTRIDIPVIDHIICTKDRYLSMFDQYQLNF